MKRVGVILSGCGFLDGAEIQESVLTLLALDRLGVQVTYFAPDKPQFHVINHFNEQPTSESRNILTEAARITRGEIQPLSQADVIQLDALLIPGGFGVAKNLSNYYEQGANCEVDQDLQRLVQAMHQAQKPQGFICIAPVLLPKLLPGFQIRLTIGNDMDIADTIEEMGGIHVVCPVEDIVIDDENRILSTPGYMLAQSISELVLGIDKIVERTLELCE